MVAPFEQGQTYRRKEIHDTYGGQRRGGISTPRKYPYVFIFTGERGEEFGYQDYWEGEVFHYTGEGQRGDMRFERGNRAMRDHLQDGERVFLFKDRDDGRIELVAEMAVRGWRYEDRKDLAGRVRRGIVFELVRVDELVT